MALGDVSEFDVDGDGTGELVYVTLQKDRDCGSEVPKAPSSAVRAESDELIAAAQAIVDAINDGATCPDGC